MVPGRLEEVLAEFPADVFGAEHRGSVTLISGTASGTFRRGHLDPEVTEFPASYPGTLAHVRLSL